MKQYVDFCLIVNAPRWPATLPDVPQMDAAELQEFFRQAFDEAAPPFVVEEVADWGARVRLPVTAAHSRPGNTVSGPALMTAADTAAYTAILAQIGPVALAVTTSLHIDFLRKPPLRDVLAEARLLKLGRRLAIVSVALWSADADGGPGDRSTLVASAQVTYSIPPS